MDLLKEYNIPFAGLSIGKHDYSFNIDESFFECFENSRLKKGNVRADLVLEKLNSMLVLDFNIKGTVQVVCDRCSEKYYQEIEYNDVLYVKFGESNFEQSDNVLVISETDTYIDVSQFIYEYIHLSLPLRCIHPGGEKKEDNCDPSVLKRLKDLSINADKQGSSFSNKLGDMEALKRLKNK